MPILILLDNSISMQSNLRHNDQTVPYINDQIVTYFNLASHGLSILFEYFQTNNKYEQTSLWTYSRTCKLVCDFTRDYDLLRDSLMNIVPGDKNNLIGTLFELSKHLQTNYNFESTCHIIIITDGSATTNLNHENIQLPFENCYDLNQLKFPERYKIHIICLTTLIDRYFQQSLKTFKEIIKINCREPKPVSIELNTPYNGGKILVPEMPVSSKNVKDLFLKFCMENFQHYSGKIVCGNLSGLITLYPNLPLEKIEPEFQKNLDVIRICGFFNSDEMSEPPVLSRHCVIPVAEKDLNEFKKWLTFINLRSDMSDEEIMSLFSDEGKQPSFAVLLHGSFKISNMIALCEIGTSGQWYGMVQTVADKKKSNLMLYTFKPGLNSIPWISSFQNFTLESLQKNPINNNTRTTGRKPVNHFVWLQQSSIQSDTQKVLRFIRKLPDKFEQLRTEICRIVRNAQAYQFFEIIDVLISIFENEGKNVSNPDALKQVNDLMMYLNEANQFRPNVN